MNLTYNRAKAEDIEVLTKTRIEVLRAANMLEDSVDMSLVEQQSREYYARCLQTEEHIAYLVFHVDKFVGAGGISFFRVMPTYHNPTGYKAYIMNMYTHPEYRRKGIAMKTLELLIASSKEKGIDHISLEATSMGRSLYEKYGFQYMQNEMEL